MTASLVELRKNYLALEVWSNGARTLPDGRRQVFVVESDGRALVVMDTLGRRHSVHCASLSLQKVFNSHGDPVDFKVEDGQLMAQHEGQWVTCIPWEG